MNSPVMKRRDFLKGIGSLLLAAALMPYEKLFRRAKNKDGKSLPLHEAMYYTVDDNLLG
jgi:hypothetical protein